MSTLEVGIVGLPNVGKSTLFNAITKAGAQTANYPFCTIEPNVGIVEVPDPRLKVLTDLYASKKTTPATCRFVDIAGLVKGAAQGEGLGNQFLDAIRQVDAIAHVVRCFEGGDITHVAGSVDPVRDVEIITTELCLADLDAVEKRLQKLVRLVKSGSKEAKIEEAALAKIKDGLEQGVPVRRQDLSGDEKIATAALNLLTTKPVLYVANLGEDEIARPDEQPHYSALKRFAEAEDSEITAVSAKFEAEIAGLDEAEAAEFLADAGLAESGLNRLIKTAFRLLGLITFLTAGPDECRAWTITKGTPAVKAAGKIHSDIERGFIRAEIVDYDDLIAAGSNAAAREKGQVRLEGKDYIMREGDVTYFRFNV